MARNLVLKALVHLESQKQLVLHPLLEQQHLSKICRDTFQWVHSVISWVLPDTTVACAIWFLTDRLYSGVQQLQFLIWQFYFQSYCVPSKWPFARSPLDIYLFVRLKICFYRQAALEQGWQILSHWFGITEGYFAPRNPLLWKWKDQFCALHSLLTPLCNKEVQRWGKQHFHLGPGWAGKQKTRRTSSSARKAEFHTLLLPLWLWGKEWVWGGAEEGCWSGTLHQVTLPHSVDTAPVRLENSPTYQKLQPTITYNPQSLYLGESLLL